jgi:hypothetical protein
MEREPYLGRAASVRRVSQNPTCHPISPNSSFSSPPKYMNSAYCQIVPLTSAEVSPVLLIPMIGKSRPSSQNQLFSSTFVRFAAAFCGYLGWSDRESMFLLAVLDHFGVG